MDNPFIIRFATPDDASSVVEIYAHYVIHTTVTFEYDVPSAEEMKNRIMHIIPKYPFLVAFSGNQMVGYAYATEFRHRAAYQWSPECTVYLHQDYTGLGYGYKLYMTLFALLRKQGFYNVFGGVALPNEASVKLHRKCGFRELGQYENIGYKFGRWHTTLWFQLPLNDFDIAPQPVIPTDKIPESDLPEILRSYGA